MRQGKSVRIQSKCVFRKTGVALLAIQMSWTSSLPMLLAHPDVDCETHTHSAEQSILIASKKISTDDKLSAAVTNATETLQPISKRTKLVPDLAEPITPTPITAATDEPTPAPVEKPMKIAQAPARIKKTKTPLSKPESASPEKTPTELATTANTEAISFHGITPGISSRNEVLESWGDPRDNKTQAPVLKYRFDALPAVEVYFSGDDVDSIVVELAKPQTAAKLRQKLDLQQLRYVVTTNADGEKVAQFYPERGVLLRYVEKNSEQNAKEIIASDQEIGAEQPLHTRIGKIIIQPIEADPFLLRAAKNSKNHFEYAIADYEAALRVDRTLADARHQLSTLHLKLGQAITAERYAAKAVELAPQALAYRLQWARTLRHLAHYDRAVAETRQVLETSSISPLLRAQGLYEMGMLASLGSKKSAKNVMPLHSKAIEIADQLAIGEDLETQLAAKQLLVDAHLAIAVEISRGEWEQKDKTVPKWIERSSALAESLIAEDLSFMPLRLQVAISALAAAANLDKPINPLLWVEEAEGTLVEIKTGALDELAASQYDWQLGLAYFHAAQIQHRRSKPDSAIRLGELADQQLSELAKGRDEMPDTAYLMGRLFFQIGAVHAVHYKDHEAACQWYDQAVNRLLNPVPVTTNATPQQHGDALVSMGVSYWSQEDHQRAIKLTKVGADLIEEAVANGQLPIETLSVPYTNLAAMHAAEGNESSSAEFQELADEIVEIQRATQEEQVAAKAQPLSKAKSASKQKRSIRR